MGNFYYSPRLYGSFLKKIKDQGEDISVTSAHGVTYRTKELINGHFQIKTAFDRLVLDSNRRMNIAFAVADWAAFMVGVNATPFFEQFIGDYGKYSSQTDIIVGAYGTRISDPHGTAQIENAIGRLIDDPYSRRAVMTIYDGKTDLIADPRDIPCSVALQFLFRQDKLDSIITMRSSDAYLGLPYDIFQFSMTQEWIARQIGAQLGTMYVNAGSLHVYEQHWNQIPLLNETRWPFLMKHMPKTELGEVYKLVEAIWPVTRPDFYEKVEEIDSQYFKNLAFATRSWSQRKNDPADAVRAYYLIHDDKTLRRATRPALEEAGVLAPRF